MAIRKHTLLLCLAAALGCPAAALATPVYSVTFLPAEFTAHDINDAGQIAGNTRTEAWIWSDTGITDLTAITPGVRVYAINNRGEAAGTYDVPGDADAFIYSGGRLHNIGRPAGLNYATPLAINDKGQVAGRAGNFPGDTSRAFFYDGRTMTAIGTFGGDQGEAYALNDSGRVVGAAALPPGPDVPRGDPRPFVYDDGVLEQIVAPNAFVATALDINDAGTIVGGAEFNDSGLFHPYALAGGVLRSLGGPGGAASGINNHGDIVGSWGARPGSDLTRAFLYRNGTFADLNDLIVPEPGWTIVGTEDINDAGQILATACLGSRSDCRSVRLDLVAAIPEPTSLAMLLGGLSVLAASQRRRRARLPATGPGTKAAGNGRGPGASTPARC